MKHFKRFKVILAYGSFLLIIASLFLSKNFSVQASDTEALITYFNISPSEPDALGSTDATYTVRFKFTGGDFIGGSNTYWSFTLNKVVFGYSESSYDIAAASGSLGHIKLTADKTSIDGSLPEEYPKISEDRGYLIFIIRDIKDNVAQNAEVEVQFTGVTNPATAGMYAFGLEALDANGNRFDALPMIEPGRNAFQYLSDPCVSVKVQNPSQTANMKNAFVSICSGDWRICSECRTDYNGLCGVFADSWSDNRSQCPTGNFYINVEPGTADQNDYTSSMNNVVNLPDEVVKYEDNPIRLGNVQLKGRLVDGALGGGAIVNNAEVNVRPADFGDPNQFKFTRSNGEGYFYLGGLSAGTYVIEFQLPFDSNNSSGITAASPISGVVVGDNGVITVPDNDVSSNSCSSVSSCDLGDITYPEAVKTISGVVSYETGGNVSRGEIEAMRDMGMGFKRVQLEDDGSYSLALGGGDWFIMPHPGYSESGSTWTFCGMPRYVSFADNNIPETKTINFTVKESTATVTGTVKKPDGTAFCQGEVQVRSKEGCGGYAPLSNDGTFSVKVPPGTYTVSVMKWGGSDSLGPPSSDVITVTNKNSPYNVGTLTMIEKKDTITGRVWSDNNGDGDYDSGEGRSAVRVEAFKMSKRFDEFAGGGPGPGGPEGGNFVDTETDSNGNYSLKVTPGMWMVNVMLDPGMMGGYSNIAANYIYTGSPQQVNVVSSDNGNTYSGNDFEVQLADAVIKGLLVNENGSGVAGIRGYAFADSGVGPMMGMGMGAPIQNSTFTIRVPAGTYNIGVEFPPESSGYTSTGMQEVTVASGETKTVNMEVKPNDKRIQVNFVDQNGDAVTDIAQMDLFAESSTGAHIFKMLYSENLTGNSVTLSVCEGEWMIGYFVDPGENNYMSEPLSKDNKVTVTSANTADNPAQVDVVLRKADSTISGIVTDPDGNPITGAWISTDNRKASNFDIAGPMFILGEATDENGHYSITLPAGTYKVQAFLPPSMGYINPSGQEVTIDANNPATVDLQFGESNAKITGSVTLDGVKQGAFVTAYSDNGGYSESTTSDGDYSLNVTKDDTWYVKAMYETGSDFYHSDIYEVSMGGSASKSQDLVLTKASFTLPSAVSSTFDYQNAKKITLSNGFSISIPAGAISPTTNATGNNITITVSPTAQLSVQDKAVPVGIGYDITAVDDSGTAITSNFNSQVTITIPYADSYLTDAIGSTDSRMLDNGYWDTTTSTWKGVTGATIDTENKTISFTVSHFTTFSILAATDPSTASETAGSTAVSSGAVAGVTSSGGESKPMAPKATGSIVEGSFNRVVLMIPSGALEWDADFEIGKLDGGFKKPRPPLWIASGPYKTTMKSWFNGAKFSNFKKPVTLIIRYDPTALGDIPESSLRLNYYDEAKNQWRPINSLLIKDRHEVAAVIDELRGTYALVGGFGYQGAPAYTGETVTAEAESEEIGLTEELLPEKKVEKEVKHPSAVPKPKAPTPAPKKEGWFKRLIKKVFSFLR